MLRFKLDPALYEWQFMDMNGNVLDRGLNVALEKSSDDFGSMRIDDSIVKSSLGN